MENGSKNKIMGYSLITAGIMMILFSVFSVFQVFTGKTPPYSLFSFNPIAIDLSKLTEGASKNANMTQELVSSDLLNKPLNMVFYLLLMGFVASAGYKIASIGVQLARAIKVNLKEEKFAPYK